MSYISPCYMEPARQMLPQRIRCCTGKQNMLIMISARVPTYVDKVNISFPPAFQTRTCMACRRTALLSFPAEILPPARRKHIVFKDSLRRSFPQCLFLVALERIPPFSQTECFSCLLFNSWRRYFVFLQTETFYFLTSSVLCSGHRVGGR